MTGRNSGPIPPRDGLVPRPQDGSASLGRRRVLGGACAGALLGAPAARAQIVSLSGRGVGGGALPAISATPAAPSFRAGTAAGTALAVLSAPPAGAVRSLAPGDGRLALSADALALQVGAAAAGPGAINAVVTDTWTTPAGDVLSVAHPIAVTVVPNPNLLPVGARVAVLGHSFVQYGNTGANSLSNALQISSNGRGVGQHLHSLMPNVRMDSWRSADARQGRYFTGANHGLSGDTLVALNGNPGLLSRVPEVTAMQPDAVVVVGGVNDPWNAGRAGAQMLADFKSIHDALRGALPNAPLLFLNVPPWGTGFSGDTAANRQAVLDANAGLASAMPGWGQWGSKLFLVDAWGATTGAAFGGTWAYAPQAMLYDTLHPSLLGAYQIDKAVQAVLSPLVAGGNWLTANQWASGNLVPNPTQAGAGGYKSGSGVSGTVPTGMTVAGPSSSSTFTCSVESNPDTGGQTLVIDYAIAGSSSTDELLAVNWNTLVGGVLANGSTGWVGAWCEWDDDGAGTVGFVELKLSVLPSYATKAVGMTADNYYANAGQRWPSAAEKRWIRTPPHVLDGTQANGTLNATIHFNPSLRPGSGRIKLRRAWAGQVPDPHTAWNA